MPVGFSFPHLKEDCQAEQVEDGEEKVAADVVDSIVFADELRGAQQGNESEELGVSFGKRPVESNALPVVVPDVFKWRIYPIPRTV